MAQWALGKTFAGRIFLSLVVVCLCFLHSAKSDTIADVQPTGDRRILPNEIARFCIIFSKFDKTINCGCHGGSKPYRVGYVSSQSPEEEYNEPDGYSLILPSMTLQNITRVVHQRHQVPFQETMQRPKRHLPLVDTNGNQEYNDSVPPLRSCPVIEQFNDNQQRKEAGCLKSQGGKCKECFTTDINEKNDELCFDSNIKSSGQDPCSACCCNNRNSLFHRKHKNNRLPCSSTQLKSLREETILSESFLNSLSRHHACFHVFGAVYIITAIVLGLLLHFLKSTLLAIKTNPSRELFHKCQMFERSPRSRLSTSQKGQIHRVLFMLFALILLVSPSTAQDVTNPPFLTVTVNDTSNESIPSSRDPLNSETTSSPEYLNITNSANGTQSKNSTQLELVEPTISTNDNSTLDVTQTSTLDDITGKQPNVTEESVEDTNKTLTVAPTANETLTTQVPTNGDTETTLENFDVNSMLTTEVPSDDKTEANNETSSVLSNSNDSTNESVSQDNQTSTEMLSTEPTFRDKNNTEVTAENNTATSEIPKLGNNVTSDGGISLGNVSETTISLFGESNETTTQELPDASLTLPTAVPTEDNNKTSITDQPERNDTVTSKIPDNGSSDSITEMPGENITSTSVLDTVSDNKTATEVPDGNVTATTVGQPGQEGDNSTSWTPEGNFTMTTTGAASTEGPIQDFTPTLDGNATLITPIQRDNETSTTDVVEEFEDVSLTTQNNDTDFTLTTSSPFDNETNNNGSTSQNDTVTTNLPSPGVNGTGTETSEGSFATTTEMQMEDDNVTSAGMLDRNVTSTTEFPLLHNNETATIGTTEGNQAVTVTAEGNATSSTDFTTVNDNETTTVGSNSLTTKFPVEDGNGTTAASLPAEEANETTTSETSDRNTTLTTEFPVDNDSTTENPFGNFTSLSTEGGTDNATTGVFYGNVSVITQMPTEASNETFTQLPFGNMTTVSGIPTEDQNQTTVQFPEGNITTTEQISEENVTFTTQLPSESDNLTSVTATPGGNSTIVRENSINDGNETTSEMPGNFTLTTASPVEVTNETSITEMPMENATETDKPLNETTEEIPIGNATLIPPVSSNGVNISETENYNDTVTTEIPGRNFTTELTPDIDNDTVTQTPQENITLSTEIQVDNITLTTELPIGAENETSSPSPNFNETTSIDIPFETTELPTDFTNETTVSEMPDGNVTFTTESPFDGDNETTTENSFGNFTIATDLPTTNENGTAATEIPIGNGTFTSETVTIAINETTTSAPDGNFTLTSPSGMDNDTVTNIPDGNLTLTTLIPEITDNVTNTEGNVTLVTEFPIEDDNSTTKGTTEGNLTMTSEWQTEDGNYTTTETSFGNYTFTTQSPDGDENSTTVVPEQNSTLTFPVQVENQTTTTDILDANITVTTELPFEGNNQTSTEVPMGNMTSTESQYDNITDTTVSPDGNFTLTSAIPDESLNLTTPSEGNSTTSDTSYSNLTSTTGFPGEEENKTLTTFLPEENSTMTTELPIEAINETTTDLPDGNFTITTPSEVSNDTSVTDSPEGNFTWTTEIPIDNLNFTISTEISYGNFTSTTDQPFEDTNGTTLSMPNDNSTMTTSSEGVNDTSATEFPAENFNVTTDFPFIANETTTMGIAEGNVTITSDTPTTNGNDTITTELPLENVTMVTELPDDVTNGTTSEIPDGNLTLTTSVPIEGDNMSTTEIDFGNTTFTTEIPVEGGNETTIPAENITVTTEIPAEDLNGTTTEIYDSNSTLTTSSKSENESTTTDNPYGNFTWTTEVPIESENDTTAPGIPDANITFTTELPISDNDTTAAPEQNITFTTEIPMEGENQTTTDSAAEGNFTFTTDVPIDIDNVTSSTELPDGNVTLGAETTIEMDNVTGTTMIPDENSTLTSPSEGDNLTTTTESYGENMTLTTEFPSKETNGTTTETIGNFTLTSASPDFNETSTSAKMFGNLSTEMIEGNFSATTPGEAFNETTVTDIPFGNFTSATELPIDSENMTTSENPIGNATFTAGPPIEEVNITTGMPEVNTTVTTEIPAESDNSTLSTDVPDDNVTITTPFPIEGDNMTTTEMPFGNGTMTSEFPVDVNDTMTTVVLNLNSTSTTYIPGDNETFTTEIPEGNVTMTTPSEYINETTTMDSSDGNYTLTTTSDYGNETTTTDVPDGNLTQTTTDNLDGNFTLTTPSDYENETTTTDAPDRNLTLTTESPIEEGNITTEAPFGNITYTSELPIEDGNGTTTDIPFGNMTITTEYPVETDNGTTEIPSGNITFTTASPIESDNETTTGIVIGNFTVTSEIPSENVTFTTELPIDRDNETTTGITIGNFTATTEMPQIDNATSATVIPDGNMTTTELPTEGSNDTTTPGFIDGNLTITTEADNVTSATEIPEGNVTFTTELPIGGANETTTPGFIDSNFTMTTEIPTDQDNQTTASMTSIETSTASIELNTTYSEPATTYTEQTTVPPSSTILPIGNDTFTTEIPAMNETTFVPSTESQTTSLLPETTVSPTTDAPTTNGTSLMSSLPPETTTLAGISTGTAEETSAPSQELTTSLPEEIENNLLSMTIKPLFGENINNTETKMRYSKGLLKAYLVASDPNFVSHRVRRAVDDLPPNPDNVDVTVTSLPTNADGTADVNFYVSSDKAAAVPASEVSDTFGRMSKTTLAAYMGTQVLTTPTPKSRVTTAPEEGSTQWLMVLTALLVVLFLILVIVLVIYWRNCYHKAEVAVTENVEIDIYKAYGDDEGSSMAQEFDELPSTPTERREALKRGNRLTQAEEGRLERQSYEAMKQFNVKNDPPLSQRELERYRKKRKDYVAGTDEPGEPRIVSYRNNAFDEDADSLASGSLPPSLCFTDDSMDSRDHMTSRGYSRSRDMTSRAHSASRDTREFRVSVYGDADSLHTGALYDAPSRGGSAATVVHRGEDIQVEVHQPQESYPTQYSQGHSKLHTSYVDVDGISLQVVPDRDDCLTPATSRVSPCGTLDNDSEWITYEDMQNNHLQQYPSNMGLDGAYCFENKSYVPDTSYPDSMRGHARNPHSRTSYGRDYHEQYWDVEAVEDMIIPQRADAVNNSQHFTPQNRQRDLFSSMSVASEDFPREVLGNNHTNNHTKEPILQSGHAEVTKHQQQPPLQFEDNWSTKNRQRDFFSSMSVASVDFPREVLGNNHTNNHTKEPILHSGHAEVSKHQQQPPLQFEDNWSTKNRQRDFFSSMSVASEDFPREVLGNNHTNNHTKEPILHSGHAELSKHQQQPPLQFENDWSTKNPRDLQSDKVYTDHTQYQPDYIENDQQTPQYSERETGRYKEDSPDVDEIYPCFDENIIPVPKETKPRRIHPLPSSRLRQSPLGGYYSPTRFEYSVFSQSTSASDDDNAEALTPYSSDQESIDSEFPQLSSAPESLNLRPVELISWDNIGQLQEQVINMEDVVLEKCKDTTPGIKEETKTQVKYDMLPVANDDHKDSQISISNRVEPEEKISEKGKSVDVSEHDTYSSLSSLRESPITFSDQCLQTSTPRDEFVPKVLMADVKLQTEQEMSTQTDSEVGTQTESALPHVVTDAHPQVSKGVQSQTSFDNSPKVTVINLQAAIEDSIVKEKPVSEKIRARPIPAKRTNIKPKKSNEEIINTTSHPHFQSKKSNEEIINTTSHPNFQKPSKERIIVQNQIPIHSKKPSVTKGIKVRYQRLESTESASSGSQSSSRSLPRKPKHPEEFAKKGKKQVSTKAPKPLSDPKMTPAKPKELKKHSNDTKKTPHSHPPLSNKDPWGYYYTPDKPVKKDKTSPIDSRVHKPDGQSKSPRSSTSSTSSKRRVLPSEPDHPERYSPDPFKRDIVDSDYASQKVPSKTPLATKKQKEKKQPNNTSPSKFTPSHPKVKPTVAPKSPKWKYVPLVNSEESDAHSDVTVMEAPNTKTNSKQPKSHKKQLPSKDEHVVDMQLPRSKPKPTTGSEPKPIGSLQPNLFLPTAQTKIENMPHNTNNVLEAQKPKRMSHSEAKPIRSLQPSLFLPTDQTKIENIPFNTNNVVETGHTEPVVSTYPKFIQGIKPNQQNSALNTHMPISPNQKSILWNSAQTRQPTSTERSKTSKSKTSLLETSVSPYPIASGGNLNSGRLRDTSPKRTTTTTQAVSVGTSPLIQPSFTSEHRQGPNMYKTIEQPRSSPLLSSANQYATVGSSQPPRPHISSLLGTPFEQIAKTDIKPTSYSMGNSVPIVTEPLCHDSHRQPLGSPSLQLAREPRLAQNKAGMSPISLALSEMPKSTNTSTVNLPGSGLLSHTYLPQESPVTNLSHFSQSPNQISQLKISPPILSQPVPLTSTVGSSSIPNYFSQNPGKDQPSYFTKPDLLSQPTSKTSPTMYFGGLDKNSVLSSKTLHSGYMPPASTIIPPTNVSPLRTNLKKTGSVTPISKHSPYSTQMTPPTVSSSQTSLVPNTLQNQGGTALPLPISPYQNTISYNSVHTGQPASIERPNTSKSKTSLLETSISPYPIPTEWKLNSGQLQNTPPKLSTTTQPSHTQPVPNHLPLAVSGLSLSSGSLIPPATDLSTLGQAAQSLGSYSPYNISTTKLPQSQHGSFVTSSPSLSPHQQMVPKTPSTYKSGSSVQSRTPSSLTEVLASRGPSSHLSGELSKRLSTTNPLPIQTIPEKDNTSNTPTMNQLPRGSTPTKILVPGQRIRASYLNDHGEQVVILAPGIGEDAPLLQHQRQGMGYNRLPQQTMSVVGRKNNTKTRDSRINDPLKVAPRPLHVQPPDRVPRSKRSRDQQTTEEDQSDSDMDVSDSASVASAGMFEHVAKMSRINDRKPPAGASPLRLRSAVVPLSETSELPPTGDVINGGDVTVPASETGSDRHNDVIQLREGLPPIKLRTNVLGTQYSSYDPKDSPKSRRHGKDRIDANDSDVLKNGNKKPRRPRQSKVGPEQQESEHSRRQSEESEDSEKGGKSRGSSRRSSLPDSETGNKQDSGRRSRSRRRKEADESDAHATGSQKGTPERSRKSSRQPSRQTSLDASMTSSIEDKADKEKKLNKQRHRSRDRDNYDHREHERVTKENESESERYQQRPKKKHRGKGMTIKQINRVVPPEPTPPPSPAAKRMAEVRTQRWKKTTEISTDHIEDRKRGRNMRAAPRHSQGSDDLRQVVTKEQSNQPYKSPRGSRTPPPRFTTEEDVNPEMLLDRLLAESKEKKRDIDAETAAKQLIDTKYIEQEQVAHGGEEVELRRHIEHHLEHGGHHHHHSHHHSREHSKERLGKDKTQIECHLQTNLNTKKVTNMLTEAFPLAQITHAKIVHNGEVVATPLSPKSSCGGYLSDATDVSHARSAYDMILTQGSATGLRNYSHGDGPSLPPIRYSHSRIGHSAPVSAGSVSAQTRSPRLATRGVWHGDSDADRNATEARISKKSSKRATSSSPRRSARSARPASARRSGSIDNLDKKALLEALQDSLEGESKRSKPSRPFSAKR